MELPTQLFEVGELLNFAGLVAATYTVVRFTKLWVKRHLGDEFVRLFALFIAFILQLFALYVLKVWTVETIGLAVLNSFLVALAASGLHEAIADPRAEKHK